MLKEFVEKIEGLVRKSQSVQEFVPSLADGRFYYIVGPDGTMQSKDVDRTLRPQIFSLDDLVEWTAEGAEPELWYSWREIVGIRDRSDQYDYATFPLTLTQQYQTLARHAGPNSELYDQRAFLRLLRIELVDCVPVGLPQQIRKVTFQHQQVSSGRIEPQKASLGKGIEMQLSDVGELPEYVSVACPVWNELPIVSNVRCALEVNLEKSAFQLIPLPGTIKRLIQNGEFQLHAALVEVGKINHIYYGTYS